MARPTAAIGFPWLSHRTVAEVGERWEVQYGAHTRSLVDWVCEGGSISRWARRNRLSETYARKIWQHVREEMGE